MNQLHQANLENLFKILEGMKIEEIEDRNLLVIFKGDVMYFRTLYAQSDPEKARHYSKIHTLACDRIRILDAKK